MVFNGLVQDIMPGLRLGTISCIFTFGRHKMVNDKSIIKIYQMLTMPIK